MGSLFMARILDVFLMQRCEKYRAGVSGKLRTTEHSLDSG
jgi:hypothetical protein